MAASLMMLKDKLYNFSCLWLTLSIIFFLAEYATDWLEVVTLGGLVLGSFIEGLCTMLGLQLAAALAGREFMAGGVRRALRPGRELLKAVIVVAAFAWEGAMLLCHLLPGYTMHSHLPHLFFLLLLYPLAGIALKLLINGRSRDDGD